MAQTGKKNAKKLTAQEKLRREVIADLQGLERRRRATSAATADTLAEPDQDRAGQLANLQATLGATLIPMLTRLVEKFNTWISSAENQRQVLSDVKAVVSVLSTVLGGLRDAFSALNEVTGSTRTTLKLLLGMLLAYKAAKIIGALAGIARNIGLIGTKAKTATPLVRGLAWR